MGLEDELAGLVEGAYAAALDDTRWADWADRLVDVMGGAMGTFVALDNATGAARHQFHLRINPRMEDEYRLLGMNAIDPQMPYAVSRQTSGFYLDTDHLDLSDRSSAEFTRWLNHSVGMNSYMTTVARLGGGRLTAGVSILRSASDGFTPVAEQEKLASILPEITRAMELAFVHGETLLDSYWSGLATHRRDATVLLDERRQVLRLTAAATRLLSRADGLDIVGGRPRAATPSEDAELQALLERVVAPHAPRAGSMRLTRRLGRPLILTAFPLPRACRLLSPAEAAALLTVIDPGHTPSTPAALWRGAFGLSPRECDVAGLLMAGHSVESASASLSISMATARIHLRRLLAKTGAARQSDLMRLLTRVS